MDVFNTPEGRASLAMTTPEYPVTPGDMYALTFITANGVMTSPIIVDANYGVNLANIGSLDAHNLRFAELRKLVEKKVLEAYPLSSPQLIVESCGMFPVYVQGEVTNTSIEYCWGLSRLSSLWSDVTAYASNRAVTLKRSGTSQIYDLYKVWRSGDLGQDPYLRPGDTVIFARYERQVTVAGAVRRPGRYQLLPGEGVKELVQGYGDGLLPEAKPGMATLVRRSSPNLDVGGVVRFSLNGNPDSVPKLMDGDTVTIASTESYLPVVYLEGALKAEESVGTIPANGALAAAVTAAPAAGGNASPSLQALTVVPSSGAAVNTTLGASTLPYASAFTTGLVVPNVAQVVATANPESPTVANVAPQNATSLPPVGHFYSKKRLTYREGELLSHALQDISTELSPDADLRHAFIARKGQVESIPIDLERLLFAYDPNDDFVLQPEDRILIPYGSADIFVTGEVTKSTWVNSAALHRLRDVVDPLLTKYASIRDVTVRNENGDSRSYDLFLAERAGDISQNPFVKGGDIITVYPFQRSVTISGQVKRPGTYQLVPGEGLRDLIENYGGGFTETANRQRVSLVRHVGAESLLGEKRLFDYSTNSDESLQNYDEVTVPSISELLPCVYLEGALGVGINGEDPQTSHRIVYTFYPGETLSQAAQKLRAQFSAVSDIANAYIKRGDKTIPVDLSAFLFNKDFTNDIALVANDTIIVPFRQFFVSVAGAVKNPGRYPYIPDRSWDYYVNLAGGIDEDKNTNQSLQIIDLHGKLHGKDKPIQPEDSIVVASNSFLYNFGKISAILSTTISVTALVLSLIQMYR
jgi:protein involved in polysaccharide export with SLBB domain